MTDTSDPFPTPATPGTSSNRRFSGWQLTFFIALAVLLTMGITGVVIYRMLFPSAFTPVELSAREQARLDSKLESLPGGGNRLEPEPYRESGASRDLSFTEKELNSLLARSPEMAERFALDLSDNLASARLLVAVPPDFPIMGGNTIALNAGLELAYANGRPIVALQGVSVWGVPIPNAWLGGLKNVDLVQEFGGSQGFWRAFADGVESIEVLDGELHIQLKE